MVHFVTLVSLYVILLYQIKVRLTLETWAIGKTYIYDSNLEYFIRGCFFIDYRTHCNIMIFFFINWWIKKSIVSSHILKSDWYVNHFIIPCTRTGPEFWAFGIINVNNSAFKEQHLRDTKVACNVSL